jgi:hypothetical protein
VTWFAKAGSVIGDIGLAVGLVLLAPLVLVIVGAPVVLIVRALVELIERF